MGVEEEFVTDAAAGAGAVEVVVGLGHFEVAADTIADEVVSSMTIDR